MVALRSPLAILAIAVAVILGPLASAAEWRSDFEGKSDLELVPAGHWEQRDGILRITKAGQIKGPVRGPTTYALAPGHWENATLEVIARSLEPTSKVGRDLVLIFGYEDPEHFYYAHVSNDSDGKTHSVIMRVEATGRTPIQLEESPKPALGVGWQTIRLSHEANGAISVWVDDQEKPVLTANDTRYPVGRLGFGSFNDTAEFDEVAITGDRVEE